MSLRSKRRLLVGAVLAALAAWGSLRLPLPRRRFDPKPVVSLQLTDRNGRLLREVLSDEGGRCRWASLSDISPALIWATIASEDKRFPVHGGVNLLAVARAVVQNIRHGRVVSGASTITQQVIRNVYRFPRTLPVKLVEAWLAARLEHTLSKEEILAQYLNRVPYGNLAFGVEAAARLYFGKPASDLSLAESAFLAALPRSPTTFNPFRSPVPVLKRQKEILRQMGSLGIVRPADLDRALREEIRTVPAEQKFRAPHFSDFVLARLPEDLKRQAAEVRTTLDLVIQEKVESLLQNHLRALERRGLSNGAAVVLDNASGDILAMAGSRDFFEASIDGQVNGATALRQPGSTLKPMTYALALENGFTAATLVEDVPTEFGTLEGVFAPENYDERYHGPIRLRSALASSYNVPAVAVLDLLGPDLLYRKLREAGFDSLNKTPGFYGVGLTLGNGEVTLLELVRGYAALARGGLTVGERVLLSASSKSGRPLRVPEPTAPHRLFSPETAYLITHILSDRDARVPAFGYLTPLNLPFPAAAKTGTSKDFRDNWTIGYTPRFTVGVWVGNFDGSPMHNVSGITGAGPLFRDIMLSLEAGGPKTPFPEPGGIVRVKICPLSGLRPGPACPSTIEEIFAAGTEPRQECRLAHRPDSRPMTLRASFGRTREAPLAIASPQDGDVFKLDPVLRPEFQVLRFQAAVSGSRPVEAVEWWVNGRRVGRAGFPFDWPWPLRPGVYTIEARAVSDAATLESRPVKIRVLS
jgi:penicillin-binding protein 1C